MVAGLVLGWAVVVGFADEDRHHQPERRTRDEETQQQASKESKESKEGVG